MQHKTILAPVSWKEMCKYCQKYKAISHSKLQGVCSVKDEVVWKDNYCTYYSYNKK